MVLYTLLTAVTSVMAYFVSNAQVCAGGETKESRKGGKSRREMRNAALMCGIFALLFLVSACRYYVGNDYYRYEQYFRLMMIEGSDGVPTEIGFNLLCKGLQYAFGEGVYLLIFAVFAAITIFFFLKGIFDTSVEFGFSFFLFMTFGYYFNSMNTIRYYLALSIVVYAVKYVLRKEYVRFIAIILLASTFHKSVLIVIPLYILAGFAWKTWQMCLLAVLAVGGFLCRDIVLEVIIRLYPTYADTVYLEGGTSPVNIIRCGAIFIMGILLYRQTIQNRRINRFFFQLNYVSLLLYLCGSFIPEVSRIGYYMNVGQLFLLPGMVEALPEGKKKKVCRGLICGAAILYFVAFLYRAKDILIKLLPYQTWIV